MSKRKRSRRVSRKRDVIEAVAIIEKGREGFATMYSVANFLDMCPSSHLMGIMNELVDDGLLATELGINSRGNETNKFWVKDW